MAWSNASEGNQGDDLFNAKLDDVINDMQKQITEGNLAVPNVVLVQQNIQVNNNTSTIGPISHNTTTSSTTNTQNYSTTENNNTTNNTANLNQHAADNRTINNTANLFNNRANLNSNKNASNYVGEKHLHGGNTSSGRTLPPTPPRVFTHRRILDINASDKMLPGSVLAASPVSSITKRARQKPKCQIHSMRAVGSALRADEHSATRSVHKKKCIDKRRGMITGEEEN